MNHNDRFLEYMVQLVNRKTDFHHKYLKTKIDAVLVRNYGSKPNRHYRLQVWKTNHNSRLITAIAVLKIQMQSTNMFFMKTKIVHSVCTWWWTGRAWTDIFSYLNYAKHHHYNTWKQQVSLLVSSHNLSAWVKAWAMSWTQWMLIRKMRCSYVMSLKC